MHEASSQEFSTIPSEAPSAVEAQWSDRALRRFSRLRAAGLVMALIGAIAFVLGTELPGMMSSFLENGGLTFLVTGLVIIAAAVRTRGAHPDHAFAPGPIVAPRMWFVLIWIAGCGVAAILLILQVADTTEQIIMLILSTILMVVGGFWVLRWLSGQLVRRWPIDPAAPLRLIPGWAIIWAGVWGLFGTILAFLIEGLPVLLLALATNTAFNQVSRSTVGSVEAVMRVLHNPLLLLIVVCGAVVVAPLIEEAIKASGLHWLRAWIRQPSDGWLLGLGAGLGFGVLEGAFNLDSANSWFAGSWIRLAALLLHGLATSLTGLGYARSLQSQQRDPLWRGYRNAVITHGLWNASALGIGLAASAAGVGALSTRLFLVCGGLLLLAGLGVFMALLIRRVARAGVETSIQEGLQLARVSMPTNWQPMKFNWGWRLVNARPIEGATPKPSISTEPPITVAGETPDASDGSDLNSTTDE